jgi:ectoine hydroxylase-related dioxygenase (phytanoyl-CoA dioxygenase family)
MTNGRSYSLAWWRDTGADKLRKNDYSTLVVPELNALLRKPVLGAIAALLCGEDVRLWHDQLLYKPPSDLAAPQSVGWHTDHGYWQSCTSDQMLTAWVPFTAMDETIGTISFVEGSLHWPENNHLNFFSSDLDGLEQQFNSGGAEVVKVPAVLTRGQVTFHHCRTIHGSGPNLTDAPRRSIALHLQPASNSHRAIGSYGQAVGHSNDELTRDADGHPNYADPTYCPTVGQFSPTQTLRA